MRNCASHCAFWRFCVKPSDVISTTTLMLMRICFSVPRLWKYTQILYAAVVFAQCCAILTILYQLNCQPNELPYVEAVFRLKKSACGLRSTRFFVIVVCALLKTNRQLIKEQAIN